MPHRRAPARKHSPLCCWGASTRRGLCAGRVPSGFCKPAPPSLLQERAPLVTPAPPPCDAGGARSLLSAPARCAALPPPGLRHLGPCLRSGVCGVCAWKGQRWPWCAAVPECAMGPRCRCGAGVCKAGDTPASGEKLKAQGEGRVSACPGLSLNPSSPRPLAQPLGGSPRPLPQPSPALPQPMYRWLAPARDFHEPGQPGSPLSCKWTPGAPCLQTAFSPPITPAGSQHVQSRGQALQRLLRPLAWSC